MKKFAVFVLVASFILYPLQTSAAVKSGDACKKIGQTATANNKKFTCVKSGKKLVWNKGVALPTPTPVATPTPTATPTPVATPTPTPTPTPVATPTPKAIVGDPCSVVGESISNQQGFLECREIANKQKKYVQLSMTNPDLPLQDSPLPLTNCRVSDQRAVKNNWDFATAFPIIWSPLKRLGSNKVLFIPIDFSDNPGSGSPSDLYGPDMRKFKEWVKWYSNGKFSINIETSEKWIRAAKPSTAYEPYMGHSNPDMKTGFEMLMKDSENIFDYSTIDAVFLIFPSDLNTFKRESGIHSAPVNTNKGLLNIGIYATGKSLYNLKYELWFWLTHEMLHAWGIMQHAPALPAVLSVNTGSVGPGQSLITWDSMIMDWANASDLWCTDLATLTSSNVVLSPLEREQKGVKSAMVKIGASKVLVLESHRKDKWGKFSNGTYGVTAYVVDTRFATDRTGEYAGLDDFTGKKYTRAANYLLFPFDHGFYMAERFDGVTGSSWGMQGIFSKNYLLYEGESFTYEGVTVKFVETGDNDTIRIEKTP